MDYVTLLTQDIEDSFQHNEKAGVVFVDLTAAYDTVWHRGLHLKLLTTHVGFHYGLMLSNRSLVVHTSNGQRSTLRRMKNSVPHGSVLSPMLYISAIFRKQHLGNTVLLTTWPSYSDAHLGRKWKTPQRMKCLHKDSSPVHPTTRRLRRR